MLPSTVPDLYPLLLFYNFSVFKRQYSFKKFTLHIEVLCQLWFKNIRILNHSRLESTKVMFFPWIHSFPLFLRVFVLTRLVKCYMCTSFSNVTCVIYIYVKNKHFFRCYVWMYIYVCIFNVKTIWNRICSILMFYH